MPFSLARLGRAFVDALPALLMPLCVVGGIVGGIVTPTEAAAVAVLVGLIVGLFIYRELSWRDLPGLLLKTAGISSTVMFTIGTASIFSWLIAIQNVPTLLADWFHVNVGSAAMFLLLVNILLLIVGMFLESISAILILVPVLMPIAVKPGMLLAITYVPTLVLWLPRLIM